MIENWFKKLFIDEAKPALKRHSGGEQPQLLAPTVSVSGDTLTITDNAGNGSFVTGYDIYVNGSVVTSVDAK